MDSRTDTPLWTDLVWSDFPLSSAEASGLSDWQWNGVGAKARASLRAARLRFALAAAVEDEEREAAARGDAAAPLPTRVVRSRVGLLTRFPPRRNRFPGNVRLASCAAAARGVR